ncbi:MAG: hypothetical protein BWK79_00275 [Beggiatoa sp. IS2]|nr:MAG: hypothetical protein BWK79_00275 [Beggiatoa sp. IS2]
MLAKTIINYQTPNHTVLTVGMAAALLAGPVTGWAKEFYIPNRIVIGVDTGYTGYANLPSFTLTDNYYPADTLSIQVSGTVDMNSGRQTVNAAGVIVAPDPTIYGQRPGQVYYTTTNHTSTPTPWGALLIGNASIGFFPIFRPSEETGLGNALPPITLTHVSIPLSDIFANAKLVNGVLPKGTVLEFRINEQSGYYGDNSGSLKVSQPTCEGHGTYDVATQALNLPFVDIIDGNQVLTTVATNLTLLGGSNNLFNLQTVESVVPVGRGMTECHAVFDTGTSELQVPFVDIPDSSLVYSATFSYAKAVPVVPEPAYDFFMSEYHVVEPNSPY